MISIDKLSFGYGNKKENLSNINLNINKGECVLLCGESGCGKTTLTKVINGLIPHFVESGNLKGDVSTANMNVSNTKMYELSKSVGSVFQNPKSQFFNIDSNNELAFGLENEGVDSKIIKERIGITVEELQIDRLLNRSIFSMSGGEKQMLAFASVYATNPDIYVLDEPTANLDSESIKILKRQIQIIKNQGHTIVIAEHRLYFLREIIDRAIYLKNGKIYKDFNKDEFNMLSEKERAELGLRSLFKNQIKVKKANRDDEGLNLEIKNLSCEVKKKEIFSNVSFSAKSGTIVGILGKNGVGKTTLSKCICGLVKEKTGSIKLDGITLSRKDRIKNSFLVMQDVNHQLFSDSVWNECESVDDSRSDKEIEEVLNTFDLLKYKDSHPMALSGGQKQRLAVSIAVLTDKKIIIFDEPTSGLDYKHMMQVSLTIKKLSERGHIILIITHDIEFLNTVCDKYVCIENEK